MAKQLIDVAVDAGADLVKFQTFSAKNVVTRLAPKADYQYNTTDKNESQYEMLKKLELSEDIHRKLFMHSQKQGIEFFSTGFDAESVDMLIRLGQARFKVPSGEITNLPLLRHIGKQKKEVILSSGMSNLAEIANSIEIIENAGTTRDKISVLHCTTSYPVPTDEVNLLALKTIRDEFRVKVGYSDHTLGIEIPIAAVALGAQVIEKHFTLDRNLPGPDHKASLEPRELQEMIRAIRNVEEAMGDGIKKIMPSETANREVVRRSIVAIKKINIGDIFTSENLSTKRPGNGLSPMNWDLFIGKASNHNYEVDELIKDES
jgi:N,N'-diacetyllegionaminate synthase